MEQESQAHTKATEILIKKHKQDSLEKDQLHEMHLLKLNSNHSEQVSSINLVIKDLKSAISALEARLRDENVQKIRV